MRVIAFNWAAMAAFSFMAVPALALDLGHDPDRYGVLDDTPTPQSVFSQPFRRIEMVRLETDLGHSQQTPGVRQRPQPDREVKHYTRIIMLNSNNDDAYFRRGIANLYAGALPRALSDMTHATELDPSYAYYAVWLDILSKRDHQASRFPQPPSHIDMTKWPAPIVRMFLGQVTPAAVLVAADN